jgi:hypothetical protein
MKGNRLVKLACLVVYYYKQPAHKLIIINKELP